MTNVKRLSEFVEEELPAFAEHKENPEEWYVLIGSMVTEYSIWADEDLPEDHDELEAELPPEDRDANPNVDGHMQIGCAGWLSDCFDLGDGDGFVSQASWGDKIDRRLMNILVVHESMLSQEALDIANGEYQGQRAEARRTDV